MSKTWWAMIVLALLLMGLLWLITPKGPVQPTPQTNNTNNTQSSLGIRVTTPESGEDVTSPLRVEGEARGTWFFEASFPLELRDANDKLLATGIAQAQGEWMTTDYVPFEGKLIWTSAPDTSTGYIFFKPDDPSGGENPSLKNVQLKWPVTFE